MARRPATLTAAFVRTVSKPGVYGDGRGSRGLSLRVHRMKSGRLSRTWRQRLRVAGRLTTTGLGRYPEVSLAEARHKAIENARAIGQGVDPRGGGVPTFREAAEETIRLHAESWKAGSPLPGEWHSTLRLYATPIRDKPVDRITSGDVLACLRPVWNVKPAAARKARNRLRAAFRWCVGQGYISTNPVDRAVAALPKVNGNGTTHHRALPHGEVPDALRRIRSANAPESARLAVELIVLTAARSGEARAATWDEIDTAAKVWTIPPARMKAGREHRVPLSQRRARRAAAHQRACRRFAVRLPDAGRPRAVLEIHFPGAPTGRCHRDDAARFPNVDSCLDGRNRRGPRDGGSRVGSRRARHRGRVHEIGPAGAPARSHAGMERLCRIVRGRMDQDGAQRRRRVHGTPTPNGRRSSFRDWAAEATDHPREVVEAAYRRSDLFERRRQLMDDWAAYLALDG